jgi:hypothetical protein
MALMHRDPNTIHLGGPIERLNEWICGVAITSGMECEFYNDSGTMKIRPLASATQQATNIVALEDLFHNKTVSDVYAIGSLVPVARFLPGSGIPSGQNIVAGQNLQANGDGWLKDATSDAAADNVARKQALESSGGAVSVFTRLRVQVL